MKTTPDINNLLNKRCKATQRLIENFHAKALDGNHRNPLYDRAQIETNSKSITVRVFQVGVGQFADKELSKGIQNMHAALAAQQ